MNGNRFDGLARTLGTAISRRGLMRGIAGVAGVAAIAGSASAKRKKPKKCNPHQQTPSESCYCLCTTDPNYEQTPERAEQCRTACDECHGDYGPVCFKSVDDLSLVCCPGGCGCVCGDGGECPL